MLCTAHASAHWNIASHSCTWLYIMRQFQPLLPFPQFRCENPADTSIHQHIWLWQRDKKRQSRKRKHTNCMLPPGFGSRSTADPGMEPVLVASCLMMMGNSSLSDSRYHWYHLRVWLFHYVKQPIFGTNGQSTRRFTSHFGLSAS